jgi:hypothetical protein
MFIARIIEIARDTRRSLGWFTFAGPPAIGETVEIMDPTAIISYRIIDIMHAVRPYSPDDNQKDSCAQATVHISVEYIGIRLIESGSR